MIYDLSPLVLIILSLAVIIFILIRKVPKLSSFDIENMPAEKQKEVKKDLIEDRLNRKIQGFGQGLLGWLKPFTARFMGFIETKARDLKKRILKVEERYRRIHKRARRLEPGLVQEQLEQLLKEASDLLIQEKFKEAEEKYIEVISLDPKNIAAYRGLGKLYIIKRTFEEAREALNYVLKLIAKGIGKAEVNDFISLGLVHREMGNSEKAVSHFKKALKLEPDNPKNLDFLCEAGIIAKDKETARKAYEGLKRVNPENQKLEEFRERIREL